VPLRTPEQVLEVLVATPGRLAAVHGPTLDRRPSPDEWSAGEVLAHLRSCGDVWGGCTRRILAEETPTIRAVNPRTWIETTDYAQRGFDQHLAGFTQSRAALLEVLSGLDAAAWERRAVVTGAGRPVERTVLSYAAWLASRERPHVRQVERAPAAAARRRPT
jgi:hypothetical protein